MPKLWFDSDGVGVGISEDSGPFSDPLGTQSIEVDAETNAGLLADFAQDPFAFTREQAAARVKPDGERKQSASELVTLAVSAVQGNRDYLAITPTAAQVAAQVKELTRQVNAILRRIVLFGN